MRRLYIGVITLLCICYLTESRAQLISAGNQNLTALGNEQYKAYRPAIWVDIRVDESQRRRTSESPLDGRNSCGNISFDPALVRACSDRGDFDVTFTGFSQDAQIAFQFALDIWSTALDLTVPIKIDALWTPLAPGVLGSAGATFIWELDDAITYPSALGDQLVGADIHTLPIWDPTDPWYDQPDMLASFNSDFSNWYFGLDGCPPGDQFDFVTVVMHEIGHGLGFFSSNRYFPPFTGIPELNGTAFFEDVFCIGFGVPFIFDTFLVSGGIDLGITGCFFERGILTDDMLTFNGPETVSCFGSAPNMFAPPFFMPGSSVSHFDEDRVTPGSINAMLTPFVAPGEAIHDPGCALAVLRDLGYTTNPEIATCPIPTMQEWSIIQLALVMLILTTTCMRTRIDSFV